MNVTAQDSVDESSKRFDNITVIAPIRQLVNVALGKQVSTGRGASL